MTRDRLSGERWARVKELFAHAIEQPADRRSSWLREAAGNDDAIVREVEALIASHEATGDFLGQFPGHDDAQIFGPGTLLGPYEIVNELGRGGSGIVYLAHDHRLGRRVALKLIAAGASPELRDRLRREARAAATIAHPAVATIYALEQFDDQLFIVSEYVEGQTLRAALGSGPLPRDRALAVAAAIARALRAAHEAGVVHRDLKPENVLLSTTGSVKVVDFGIARVTGDDDARLTRQGALLGTPAYMAPEQLVGTAADARADVYAFGIVLSEMVTGRHPGIAAPPTAADTDPLLEVARRCMQVDPGSRIQSAALLVAALDHANADGVRAHSNARWWWEFHQVVVAVVYWLTLWPAWHARSEIAGPLGRTLFIVVLAAVVFSTCLRLHLWFTSRFSPAELTWVRQREARWITLGDGVFAASVVSAALLIRTEHSSIDVLLLSIGLGAAVAFLAIEPATTRAAFKSRD